MLCDELSAKKSLIFVSVSKKTFTFAPAIRPDGGIGRRVGLKHQWGNTRAGSTPALGTEN